MIMGELAERIRQWVCPEEMNQNPEEIPSHNPYGESAYVKDSAR